MSDPRPPRTRGPKGARTDPAQLLDAAQAVFGRMGVQGTSIRAVAQEAGCDPALIYYHFENKEALFRAVLDRKFGPFIRDLEALQADRAPHPFLRLWGILQIFNRHLGGDAGWRDLIRGQVLNGAESVRDLVTSHVRLAQEQAWQILQQGIASGHLRADLNVPLSAFFLMRTYTEILDLIPAFAERIAQVPPKQALALAQREWMNFFWRGAAADPALPVPELPGLEHP